MNDPTGPSDWSGGGVSIGAALTGTIPLPTRELRWGEDIPREVMHALHAGETALLRDAEGQPFSLVLMDRYGRIRERRLEPDNRYARLASDPPPGAPA